LIYQITYRNEYAGNNVVVWKNTKHSTHHFQEHLSHNENVGVRTALIQAWNGK